jgi:hypothetical protein
MAQSLKQKITKLADQFNIDAIIQTAQEVKVEQVDIQAWTALSTEQKTKWFMDQCAKYKLTPEVIQHDGTDWRICVKELKETDKAYFTVFLPHIDAWRGVETEAWHLEIGGAYVTDNNGGIWSTAKGLKGKEKQIAEVMRLHAKGE